MMARGFDLSTAGGFACECGQTNGMIDFIGGHAPATAQFNDGEAQGAGINGFDLAGFRGMDGADDGGL